jgi:hypothetical protein
MRERVSGPHAAGAVPDAGRPLRAERERQPADRTSTLEIVPVKNHRFVVPPLLET